MLTNDYPFDFIPAQTFSYEELTEAYNQTRVDYIVPMPMNAARLRAYVETYDVDMAASAVAVDGNEILGLAMLGRRGERAWLTRLGVIRSNRRQGTGQGLVEHLLGQARQEGVTEVVIEVIENNEPAYQLFTKMGFQETRDLLVLRRPPREVAVEPTIMVQPVSDGGIVDLLRQRRSLPSWVDETASLLNAGDLAGLRVDLPDGNWGWLVYQNTLFHLGRLVIQTEIGDPVQVGDALLRALHQHYPFQDTKTENLPADDPHWPAFEALGYIVSFRRNEMRLWLK